MTQMMYCNRRSKGFAITANDRIGVCECAGLLGRDQLRVSLLWQLDGLRKFAKSSLYIAGLLRLFLSNAGLQALATHCDSPLLLVSLDLQHAQACQTSSGEQLCMQVTDMSVKRNAKHSQGHTETSAFSSPGRSMKYDMASWDSMLSNGSPMPDA